MIPYAIQEDQSHRFERFTPSLIARFANLVRVHMLTLGFANRDPNSLFYDYVSDKGWSPFSYSVEARNKRAATSSKDFCEDFNLRICHERNPFSALSNTLAQNSISLDTRSQPSHNYPSIVYDAFVLYYFLHPSLWLSNIFVSRLPLLSSNYDQILSRFPYSGAIISFHVLFKYNSF